MTSDSPAAPARRGPAPSKPADILWAAARLFAQRGVAQTSTREIAAAAATTERTLFKHFASKDGLVHAVIEQAVLQQLAPGALAELQALIQRPAADLAAWHQALLAARGAAAAAAPELTRLLLVELLRDAALRERFAAQWRPAVWSPLTALFSQLQAQGRLRADMPATMLARQFLSLNLGHLVARHVLAPDLPGWDDAAEQQAIARLFADGAAPR